MISPTRIFSLMLGLCGLFVFTSVGATDTVAAPWVKPLKSRPEALVVPGTDFQEMLGTEIESISVFAVNNKQELEAIAFQIDERFENGEFVLIENKLPGTGKLTAQDELVFMARDAGERLRFQDFPMPNRLVKEIEVYDANVEATPKGYVYVVATLIPQISQPPQYVHFEAADLTVSAATYHLNFRLEEPLFPVQVKSAQVKSDPAQTTFFVANLIEGNRLQIQTGILADWVKSQLDLKDLEISQAGFRTGPIRTIRKIRIRPKLGYGQNWQPFTLVERYYDRFVASSIEGQVPALHLFSTLKLTFAEQSLPSENRRFSMEEMSFANAIPNSRFFKLNYTQTDATQAVQMVRMEVPSPEAFEFQDTLQEGFGFNLDVNKLTGGPLAIRFERYYLDQDSPQAIQMVLDQANRNLRTKSRVFNESLVMRAKEF